MKLYEKIHELIDKGYTVKFERQCLPEEEYYKCLKITVSDAVFRNSKLLSENELRFYKHDKDELISTILGYLEEEIKSRKDSGTITVFKESKKLAGEK